MENLWKKYGGSVQFVAVNMMETLQDLNNWLGNMPSGITFPVLHSTNWSIANLYASGMGTIYWPLIYIIGADGIVRGIYNQGILYAESELEGHILDVVYQRPPVSLELVVDVSSSMLSPASGGPTSDSKLTLLQQAANIVLNVLVDHGQTDDTMGLTRFTDDASEFVQGGKKLISVAAHSAQIKSEIDTLQQHVGTCTAMGAGLQRAFDTLVAEAANDRFVILCTDGMQNIEPKVTNVSGHYEIRNSGGWLCGGPSSVPEHPGVDITTYDTRVHTIGIGVTANYEPLLQDLADQTGAFYRGTNDPQNDLDLIYAVNLCNCLAQGSPAVVCHTTGTLIAERCQAVETFFINRTARKISVVLSWLNGRDSNLTFWLHAPDGTLVKLDRQLKTFENYCMATIYLPVQQHGKNVPSVGRWTMVIRGETEGGRGDYHAMVIAEDREVKCRFDYPRKVYCVGDILPVRMRLAESKKPVTRVTELVMERAEPRVPVAELMAEYKISRYELQKAMLGKRECASPEAQIHEKLRAMEATPRFAELLIPTRKRFSLAQGSLECKISEGEITIPVPLRQPGLHSFKLMVQCETPESGPICRTDIVSVLVGAGHADPKRTNVTVVDATEKNLTGTVLYLTPRNERGQLLGPGRGHEIKASSEKRSLDIHVVDYLDGTYQIEIPISKKAEKQKVPVIVSLQGKLIWKGTL
jgi:hypothetical protein